MSVNIKVVREFGGTQEALKTLLSKPRADLPQGVQTLLESQRSRINSGATRCLSMAPYWRAIDRVFEAPFESCSYSIVRDMISMDKSQEDVLSTLRTLGLSSSSFLVDAVDVNGVPIKDKTGKTAKVMDFPMLRDVILPLTSYYSSIREAKITADVAGQQPLYKYSPAYINEQARAQCEIVTSIVEEQTGSMGYRATERDAIGPMLRYSEALQFPMEDFYQEKYWATKDEQKVSREGVRWHTPHPTRWFCDRSDPLFRINTDTGCRWGGYWTIMKYRDIAQNDAYFNKENVNIAPDHWYRGKLWQTYAELYPCTIKPPGFTTAGGTGLREDQAFTYSTQQDDSGVPVTIFFDRINPKAIGLYDYDGEVWHRFVWCGDTVIACDPWGYTPMVAYLYNHDSRRERNVGLGLELMPFQDQMQNILTQYLLTMRQALQQITFYDATVVDGKDIVELRGLGEKKYRTRQFVPFKAHKLADQGTRVDQLFYTPVLPTADPSVVLQGLRALIEIMERMLGYTAQEVGAVASHEQTAYEVNIVDSHASNRTQLTEASVFDAIAAKKQALYLAFCNYGSDEVIASVAKMNGTKKKALEDMGFDVEVDEATSTAGVTGPKTPLLNMKFSNTADGDRRVADQKIALAMINIFQMVLSNPMLIEKVGVRAVVERFNEILNWAGVPGEWRFNAETADTPEKAQEQAGQLQQVVQGEIAKFGTALADQVIKPLQAKVDESQQAFAGVVQALKQMQTEGQQKDAANQQILETLIGKQKQVEQVIAGVASSIGLLPTDREPLPGEVPAAPPLPTEDVPMGGPVIS